MTDTDRSRDIEVERLIDRHRQVERYRGGKID